MVVSDEPMTAVSFHFPIGSKRSLVTVSTWIRTRWRGDRTCWITAGYSFTALC